MATEITSIAAPLHMNMHTETVVNDNTIRTYTRSTEGYSHILAVFNSPKGRDRQLVTFDGNLTQFKKEWGDGPFSVYGQPFLNAKAAAATESAILHCIRVTADDATYANRHIYARYRIIRGETITNTVNSDPSKAVTIGGIQSGGSGTATYESGIEKDTVTVTLTKESPDVPIQGTPLGTELDSSNSSGAAPYANGGISVTITDYSIDYSKWTFDSSSAYKPDDGDKGATNLFNNRIVLWFDANSANPTKTYDVVLVDEGGNTKTISIVLRDSAKVEPDVTVIPSRMEVMFIGRSNPALTDLKDLVRSAPEPEEAIIPAEDGGPEWRQVRFMSIAATGRGSYGKNYSVRISNNYRADKISIYKNYFYTLFEGTEQLETKRACLYPEAIISNESYYLENILNDVQTGSQFIKMDINDDVLTELYLAYKNEVEPKTTLTMESFDPILGINKNISSSANYSKYNDNDGVALTGYEVISDANIGTVQFNDILGFSLEGGSDGSLAPGMPNRDYELDKQYVKAFTGELDRNVLSKYRCPLDAVFDANYSMLTSDPNDPSDVSKQISVKLAMATLNDTRHEDHMTYFDLGTDIYTLSDPYEIAEELNEIAKHWTYSVDGWYGQIKDPYNRKLITLTGTYELISKLPTMWKANQGKYIPFAGVYGAITSFIPDTIFPVYDENLDQIHLDRLKDDHINYLQTDAKNRIIRANQDTRYPKLGTALTMSNLTEINNAHIILDIKKDAEKIASEFHYRFNESSELSAFSARLSNLVDKYKAAQVKKISAAPSRTEEEAELGILHLYIEVVHKALVRIVQIDIDVNRGVES